jgi:hypothetical protein
MSPFTQAVTAAMLGVHDTNNTCSTAMHDQDNIAEKIA